LGRCSIQYRATLRVIVHAGIDVTGESGADEDDALEREAIAWLTRVTDDEATSEDHAGLQRWQAQSPAHAAAFAKASKLWQAMPGAIETIVRTGKVTVPVMLGRDRPLVPRRAVAIGFAAASAAAAGYLLVRPPLELWPSFAELRADYRTGTGEQRKITIAAAIAVDMNTRTSIALRPHASDLDRFELLSGEAIVGASVRPVQVIAADGMTTMAAAKVDIRRNDTTTCVTCLAGAVEVGHRGHTARLQDNQQVVYGVDGFGNVTVVDPLTVTSWQEGYLMFRKEPLASVIAEVNRYRPGRIVLLDSNLGRGLVTARFRLDRLDDVIVQIREVFGASIRTLPGGLVLVG
jgi:transmembrane sensor